MANIATYFSTASQISARYMIARVDQQQRKGEGVTVKQDNTLN